MKNYDLTKSPPIIVFGTGGSGTRVVAEILREAECYIGSNLNHALDNQDFGFLLAGRVDWMINQFPFQGREAELVLFHKIFFQLPIHLSGLSSLLKITFEYFFGRTKKSFRRRPLIERGRRGLKLLDSVLFNSQRDLSCYQRWGFKSPEAIYFLYPLIQFYPGAKLIHLLRDGRDMALSTNQSRLQYLDIFPVNSDNLHVTAFQQWCLVNKWAQDVCKAQVPENQYLQFKYEDICSQPRQSIDKILTFAGLNITNPERIYEIPKPNPSIQRWKQHGSFFTQLDSSILNLFGYGDL